MSDQQECLMKTASAEILVNSNPDYSGAVQKKNNAGKFQYRYCIIHHGIFYYYEDWKSKRPRGAFSLAGYRAIKSTGKNESMFIIRSQDKRTYLFSAGSKREVDEWVRHVNLAVEKYHPTNSPFYNPYDENAQLYIEQHTLNRTTLKRSPSITSSTSSSSTSSNGSVKSNGDGASLYGDPIYEELDKNKEPVYDQVKGVSHYDQLPKPYDYIKERRSSRHDGSGEEDDDIDAMDAPYVDMGMARAVALDFPDGEYEKMSRARPKDDVNDTYETMNTSLIDDTLGYEDMSPEKYKGIMSTRDQDEDELENPDPEMYDYLRLLDDSAHLDPSGNVVEFKTDNFDAYAKLPPLPPERLHPADVRESKIERENLQTGPVPKPRICRSMQDLSVVDDENHYTAPPPILKPRARSHRYDPSASYQVNEIIPRRRFDERKSSLQTDMSRSYDGKKMPIPPPRSRVSMSEKGQGRSDVDILPSSVFFAGLGKEMCLRYLGEKKEGCYLIRTERSDGHDALAVRSSSGDIKHFIIFNKNEQYYLKNDEPAFHCVGDLLRYYYENTLPTVGLCLTGPFSAR